MIINVMTVNIFCDWKCCFVHSCEINSIPPMLVSLRESISGVSIVFTDTVTFFKLLVVNFRARDCLTTKKMNTKFSIQLLLLQKASTYIVSICDRPKRQYCQFSGPHTMDYTWKTEGYKYRWNAVMSAKCEQGNQTCPTQHVTMSTRA